MCRNKKWPSFQNQHAQRPSGGTRELIGAIAAKHPAANDDGVERWSSVRKGFIESVADISAKHIQRHCCPLHIGRRRDRLAAVCQAIEGHPEIRSSNCLLSSQL